MFACCFPSAKSILTTVPPSTANEGLNAVDAVSPGGIGACTAASMTFSSTEVSVKLDEAKIAAANLNDAIVSAVALTDSLNATVASAVANTGVEVPIVASAEAAESDAIITEISDTDEEVVGPEPVANGEKL
jgi:hypothetical protein